MTAHANREGSITIDSAPKQGSIAYRVERQAGDEPNDPTYGLTPFTVTEFTDTNTTAGTSYTYRAIGIGQDDEPKGCGDATITAILEFPAPVLAAPRRRW